MTKLTVRLSAFLVGALLACSTASADVWQAQYGVAKTFDFVLFNADGTLDVDEVDGGTEVTIDCNGTPATATNDFVDEGAFYSISVTAAELQCQRTTVTIGATLTSVFFVETCGHASAFNITLCWETGDPFARIGAAGAGLTNIDLPNQTMDITGTLSTVTTVGTVNALGNDAIAAADVASDVGPEIMGSTPTGNGPWPALGITDAGTAISATATTLVLRAATPFASDDAINGSTLWALGSTQGYWQARVIDAYTTADDTATVATWDVTPSGTITYQVFGTAPGGAGTPLTAAETESEVNDALVALNLDHVAFTATGIPAFVSGTYLDQVKDETALIVADTNELQVDWADGGRLDLILDARASQTSVNTVDDFLDTEITALMNARTQLFPGGVDADSVLTADSGDANTLVDTELTFAAAEDIDGAYVVRVDGQRCLIDSFTPATDTIEFAACAFTGVWSTQTYKIYPAGTQ